MALPREPKRNDPIRAADIKAIIDETLANRVNVGPGSGLGMHRGPNGTDLWAMKFNLGVLIGKTTTTISAAVTTTLGSGSGQIEGGSTTAIVDPTGTPPTVTFYSNDTQSVDSGAYVVVVPFRDGYMILHARCGDLS